MRFIYSKNVLLLIFFAIVSLLMPSFLLRTSAALPRSTISFGQIYIEFVFTLSANFLPFLSYMVPRPICCFTVDRCIICALDLKNEYFRTCRFISCRAATPPASITSQNISIILEFAFENASLLSIICCPNSCRYS